MRYTVADRCTPTLSLHYPWDPALHDNVGRNGFYSNYYYCTNGRGPKNEKQTAQMSSQPLEATLQIRKKIHLETRLQLRLPLRSSRDQTSCENVSRRYY